MTREGSVRSIPSPLQPRGQSEMARGNDPVVSYLLHPFVRSYQMVRPRMSVPDVLELILAFGLLVYLVYVLIRPEKF